MTFETLEKRRMMSVSALVVAGILVVTGDGQSNEIVVADQGDNKFVVGSDGEILGGDDFTFNGVTNAVIVAAGGGDDTVVYDDSGPAEASTLRLGAAVSLGTGNDTAIVGLFHANTHLAVDGGAGQDIIVGTAINQATLVFSGGADSDGGSLDVFDGAQVSVDAGAGNDAGNGADYTGFNFNIQGGAVRYDGGAGDDVVTALAETGGSSFVLSGGAGNDSFVGLHVAPGAVGYVYAGAGNDTVQVNGVDSDVRVVDGREVTINGKLYIWGEAGNDTINLVSVSGLAFVYGGAGNDTVTLGYADLESGNQPAEVTGHLTFDSGAGRDLLVSTLSQTDPHLTLAGVEKVTDA